MFAIRTILHPTDFSAHSQLAFQLACSLVRSHQARVIVLHVVPVPLIQEKRGYLQEMEAELRQLQVPATNVSVERRLDEGDPATQILQAAVDTQCDLIVMGTHGHTGLRRLLMGSVAEQVLRRAPCPVLTAKSPAELLPEAAEAARVAATSTWALGGP